MRCKEGKKRYIFRILIYFYVTQILERLYCSKWTKLDGLGALVITPTRELAYQIFETLRNVGRFHEVSAGLIIGGKDLHFEKNRLDHCNIIICTPGRLLQHMDTNPLFNCDNLKVRIKPVAKLVHRLTIVPLSI